jgi:hypothetical protein
VASKAKQPPGPPMTLGNMRHLGVHRLVACCLNPSCWHEGLIDASKFADDVEVPSFARGRHIDVRPNWKDQLPSESPR